MKICVEKEQYRTVFVLEEGTLSASLFAQAQKDGGFAATGETAHGYEVVFQAPCPPAGSPQREDATPAGTLAYYAPNHNICMFFMDEPGNDQLYILGQAEEGAENISRLTGTIHVTAEPAMAPSVQVV